LGGADAPDPQVRGDPDPGALIKHTIQLTKTAPPAGYTTP
jgi:hypothetical protein